MILVVSIKAVRASSGNPIASCQVSVHTGFEQTVRHTNEKGVAHFESINPGTYTVCVEGKEKNNVALEGEVVLYV